MGNQVVGIAVSNGTSLNTIGFDDTMRTFDSASGQYGGAAVSLSAQPRGIEQHGDATYMVTLKSIVVMKGGSVQQEIPVEFEPSCCSYRKVTLFSAGGGYDKPNNREWGFHTAKVNCVAWAPNSVYVASGGLDTNIILWSVEAPDKHCIIRNAHDQSQITNVAWLDNSSLVP